VIGPRAAAGLAIAALGLAACGGGKPAPAERHVAIYNWSDYIGETTIADFERETGIKVEYDTFDADSTLEAKMLAGGAGYDVVSTSENFFSRQIKAGAYQVVDRSRLPNWGNLDPEVLRTLQPFDPGNVHAVPYLHSFNGFAYNVPMIRARMKDAPVDSLDMIFKPDVVKRFADCGVTFLDSPDNVLQLALRYLRLDPNSDRPEDFEAAAAVVLKVRPYVKHFDSDYINPLATGETCLAMAWSSDYAVAVDRARAAGVDLKLHLQWLADPLRRATRRRGARVHQLHAAAGRDRQGHELHALSERDSGLASVRESLDPQRPDAVPAAGVARRSVHSGRDQGLV
jgi:putrescine transport system substrate-binding protein